ncbi:hypothetical protein Pla52o_53940 [Novipirellula galeiformis]|uniref:Neutral/alkaline non-lysosomal ceramidase n=2 Tax=Novipirellula galeiformis TaxID=2528004 RepID=A0A5C6C2Z1_9BACT|nr:hypothetical protein Pla52o_53940 [Novipirellula galeiformis]
MKVVPMKRNRWMMCSQKMNRAGHGKSKGMRARWLSAVAVIFCAAWGQRVEAADAAVFSAGAAKVAITPSMGMPIVGNWTRPTVSNIHDDLHVRCLALHDGKTTIAFAICDSVGIPREVYDAARKFIDAETDVPSANVLMSATHTHSGVSAGGSREVDGVLVLSPYQTLVARRIADGVGQAIARMQPARIGWGGVEEASEVHNRRWYVKDARLLSNPFGGVDQVRMNPPAGSSTLIEPAGPIDPEVSFLSVQTLDGKPLALLANYSLHYVGGVPAGDVSADYFGAFAEKIGKHLGVDPADQSQENTPFLGILTNGTSGDINNIPFKDGGPKHAPYEKIEQVSELIAKRVATAYQSITHHDWVPLTAASEELVLQMRKPDPEMLRYFASLQDEGRDPASIHRLSKNYAKRVQSLAEGPESTTVLLQAFGIGDLGVTAIPFEVFVETGLDLKERNPFADSFTIELANGSYGYLPTPRQHKLGGYETWMGTNRVQLDASERISEVLLSLLNKMSQK